MKLISIVTSCFNEAGNVSELYERIRKVFDEIGRYRFELLIIDNCSTDGTVDELRVLAARDRRVKVILNTRNFGHIRAPQYALRLARGDAVVSMVSDLQDPPEMIRDFLAKWEEGWKVVVAVKTETRDSLLLGAFRRAYYRLIRKVSDAPIIENFTGFGLYDRRVMDIVRTLDDPYPYFRGLISELGLPVHRLPLAQPARRRGITKNNFLTLYDVAMLGLTNHSRVFLRLATMSGFALAALSMIVSIAYLVYKLIHWDSFQLGLAPLVIGLFFFNSVLLVFVGLLGEYVGAIHTRVVRRPMVVEAERLNFDDEEAPPT